MEVWLYQFSLSLGQVEREIIGPIWLFIQLSNASKNVMKVLSQSPFICSKSTIRTMYEICSELTIKAPNRRHWHRPGVFIVDFDEQISHFNIVYPLLTLNKWMPAGIDPVFLSLQIQWLRSGYINQKFLNNLNIFKQISAPVLSDQVDCLIGKSRGNLHLFSSNISVIDPKNNFRFQWWCKVHAFC